MTGASGLPAEVSGFAHLPEEGGRTGLRLEGPAVSVASRREALLRHFGGKAEVLQEAASRAFWEAVRDVRPLAGRGEQLWRLSVAPAEGAETVVRLAERGLPIAGRLYDWAGGLVWLAVEAGRHAAAIREGLAGHATCISATEEVRAAEPVFHPQPPALAALSRRVKESFDPEARAQSRPHGRGPLMQTDFSLAQLADPDVAASEQILRRCVHCGFCTATCPTFKLLGDELDSPRGRIYLIKDMLENDRPADARTVRHIDRCLSCLSCMTTCPSSVHYMHLVDHARAHIEQTFARPLPERWLRRLLALVLPRPALFRAALLGAMAVKPFARLLPGRLGVIADWAAGDWEGMSARLDRIVADEPRDVVALQVGHLSDFFLGNRDNLRGRVARALPAYTGDDPGYGFLLGMAAFGLEECGDYGAAEDAGRQAIDLEPDDCWAQHALCHIMEMQARQEEGIAFMEGRRAHWAQDDNGFAFHNWWHVSLFNLDNDRFDRALEICDAAIRPGSSEVQLEMLDAAALLWRLRLRGIDTGDRYEKLAATYEALAEHGFYAFNDMHAMMAYVATGRDEAADSLERAAAEVSQGTGSNARMTREVGLPIVRAIRAFGAERYGETVDLLMPVRYRAQAFGGSHAQRDIVHRTLIEAAIRAGQHGLAQALANERMSLKPDCPFSRSLGERARALAN